MKGAVMRVYLRAQTDSVWFEVEDFKIAPQILTRIVCLAQEPIRSWLVAYLGMSPPLNL